MSRQRRDRGSQRPTRGVGRPQHPGYFTDPERDQEWGGMWGMGPRPGTWTSLEEDRSTTEWTSSSNREPLGRATPRPSPFETTTFTTQSSSNTGSWNPPPVPRGPTSMTNRIFEDAMSTARGRSSPYGIRMVSRATPRAPSNINTIETDSPAYSMSRRRASPVDSSPDSITGSLVERVRRAGIITDIDD